MQKLLIFLFKILKYITNKVSLVLSIAFTRLLFYLNNVKVGQPLRSKGIPYVSLAIGGTASIGNNFKINNTISSNPIGRSHKCVFAIGPKGLLTIGNNVGMSFTAISCQKEITIHNNVMIGGGTCIYDSDFHPLNATLRNSNQRDTIMVAAVIIEENVFVGTNSTVLKGVTIGRNSIIGACSVVTKDVPPNEIWAGNPAKFIKKLD
jgi:acetyltransferase-like isoleucine patch superfamily enzyme